MTIKLTIAGEGHELADAEENGMTIKLTIAGYQRAENIYFNSMEEAQKELDLLKPKMVSKFRISRNDGEDTHTVNSPSGPCVVVLEHVHVARIVDVEAFDRLVADENEQLLKRQIAVEVSVAAAKKAAGV